MICTHDDNTSYFIFQHVIYVCPIVFTWSPEPPFPDPRACPTVTNNMFSSRFELRLRSELMLQALVYYKLPLHRPIRGRTLNDLVALTAQESYMCPLNYRFYAHRKF